MLKDIKKIGKDLHLPITLDQTLEFLVDTIKKNNVKTILEIGSAVGYSAIAMAQCGVKHIDTVEIDAARVKIAKENIKIENLDNIIDVIDADAKDFLAECTKKYDFVYLDGPKGQYINYLDKLIECTKIGGIIFADNVLFKGMVRGNTIVAHGIKAMIKNLRLYLNRIENHPKLQTQIFEIGDGVSVSKKIKE